jgi:hypothetical protein
MEHRVFDKVLILTKFHSILELGFRKKKMIGSPRKDNRRSKCLVKKLQPLFTFIARFDKPDWLAYQNVLYIKRIEVMFYF